MDLSPDEDKDKDQLKRMVLYKMLPPDFNAPLIAEQIVNSCFTVKSKHLDRKNLFFKKLSLETPRANRNFLGQTDKEQKQKDSPVKVD